jgi:hypothetical protein
MLNSVKPPVKMFVLLVFLFMFSSAVNDRFKEHDGARLDDIGLSTEPIVDWLTEPLEILVGSSVGGLIPKLLQPFKRS